MIIKTILFLLFIGLTWASAPSTIHSTIQLENPPLDPPIQSAIRDSDLRMVWNGDRFVWKK